MGLPLGEWGEVRGLGGRSSPGWIDTPLAPAGRSTGPSRRPAGRARPGRAGEGDSSCPMQMSWAGAGRRSGEQRSLGGGGCTAPGDRGATEPGSARTGDVRGLRRSGRMEGSRTAAGGGGGGGRWEGGTLTLDGKVWSGLSGAGAREAGWDRPGGVSARPGPLFPPHIPTPRRAGVHGWLSWTTYPRLRSRVGPLPAGRWEGRGGGRGGGAEGERGWRAGRRAARVLRPGSSAGGLPRELCSRFISISLPCDRRLGAARARPVLWVVPEGVAP